MTITRRSHVGEPLTYAAVGASQAPDVLLYPPKGFRSAEQRIRLGSGRERFDSAVTTLLTWGIQRASGFEIDNVEPAPLAEYEYQGLVYDESGVPIAPRTAEVEDVFTDDGTPGVAPGVSAELVIPVAWFTVRAPVRVISVTDEPNRAGYSYGTLAGHPLTGEETFMVEMDTDGGVWFIITSVFRPSSRWLGLAWPLVAVQRTRYTARYLKALLPGRV